MTVPRRFRLAADVLAQTSLEEAVLLDARAGKYFAANIVASTILRDLVAGLDEAMMLQNLLGRFDQQEAELRADLAACLDDWQARGLIELLPA